MMGVKKAILPRGFSMLLKLGLWSKIAIPIDPREGTPIPAGRKLLRTLRLKSIRLMAIGHCPGKIARPFKIS